MTERRLYRSRSNVMLGGVAAGLAEYLNTDPNAIRLIIVLVAVMTGFFPVLLAYAILWALLPLRP